MNRMARLGRWLLFAIPGVLFVLAVLALRRELAGLDVHRVAQALGALGGPRLATAFALTVASFLSLGLIEFIAVRSLGEPTRLVRARTAMVTGFVAHSLTQNIGFGVLTQAAVRMRAYGPQKVGGRLVARVSAVVLLAVSLGPLALGAVTLLVMQPALHLWDVAIPATPAGLVLTALVLVGLLWSVVVSRMSATRDAESRTAPSWMPVPSVLIVLTVLSALDWLVTGSVLYALLPAVPPVPFGAFIGAYILAQLLAVTSHVPGGVGVFEATLLAMLAADGTPELKGVLVASLVAYRACYYLLPLVTAVIVIVVNAVPWRTAEA